MARMLTRRAARHFPLQQLPDAFLQSVLAQLPADQRARLASLCRALRDAAKHPRLWQVVDLTRAGGLTCTCLNPAVILHAMVPQLAPLRVLRVQASAFGDDLSEDTNLPLCLRHLAAVSDALCAALLKRGSQAGEPSLSELHLVGTLQLPDDQGAPYAEGLAALLRTLQEAALVTLDVLECVTALGVAALSLPNLRVRHVRWKTISQHETNATPEQLFLAMESHAPLQALTVVEVGLTAEQLERVVDVVLKRQLTKLALRYNRLDASSAPQLTRLLQDSALRSFSLAGPPVFPESSLFDSVNRPLFASALRTNTTLKELTLSGLNEWRLLMPALCAALAGHPSIESLCFWEVVFGDCRVDVKTLDASLARLLTADAPGALARLHVNFFVDGVPVQLPRMFSALADNTYLRALNVGILDSSAPSMLDTVVPALRTNTGLRELHLGIAGRFVSAAAKRALFSAAQRWGPWNPPL